MLLHGKGTSENTLESLSLPEMIQQAHLEKAGGTVMYVPGQSPHFGPIHRESWF